MLCSIRNFQHSVWKHMLQFEPKSQENMYLLLCRSSNDSQHSVINNWCKCLFSDSFDISSVSFFHVNDLFYFCKSYSLLWTKNRMIYTNSPRVAIIYLIYKSHSNKVLSNHRVSTDCLLGSLSALCTDSSKYRLYNQILIHDLSIHTKGFWSMPHVG